jgi:hypothetical protein
MRGTRPTQPPLERFWSRVQKTAACWLWTGNPSNRGYGQITVGGVTWTAHRYSYFIHNGPIPDGHEVDHLCRVRLCVNPAHLEVVTHHQNLLRGSGFAATNAAKTQCANGHEFTPENTYVRPSGWRSCRTCKRATDARARTRKRLDIDYSTTDVSA